MLSRYNAAIDDVSLWKKGLAVVSIPLLILLVTLGLGAWHDKVSKEAQQRIQHSLRVKASIFEVLSIVVDAETGVRGYLLWREPVYLDPYNEARIQLSPALDGLGALVQNNSNQASRIRELRAKAFLKLDALNSLKQNPDFSDSAIPPVARQSQQAMEDVRSILNSMTTEEDALLSARISKHDRLRGQINVMLGILLLAALLCGMTASYIVSAGILRRVKNLEEYASRVSRGQPALWKDSGLDEIGSLGHSVQVMTTSLLSREEALRDAQGKLSEANINLEAQLTETQSANQELEAFSYSVSHDLRAPLRHVAGFSELMLKNSESLDAKNQRYLNIIVSSIQQMGVLIDDLLAFSRMGRTSLKSDPVDLNRIIVDVLTDLGPEMQGRNVDWRISPLPVVLGDNGTIRLVFQNLLSNALKYSRTRESAIIIVEVEDQPGVDMTKIIVSDNGSGFDMQYHDKLFGVFQRLHSAEEFEGTGIGLATVRRIVQRHGGAVTAFGEIDVGAKFSFTLPREGNQLGH